MIEVIVEAKMVTKRARVTLNNYDELTAKAARAAAYLAYGPAARATVTDGKKTYRVTRAKTRLMKKET